MYRYISADSHFECPPETWTHRVPQRYQDRVPRRIRLANGNDGLVSEGRPLTYGGTSLYAGSSPEDFSPTVMNYEHSAGTGTPEQRLAEQDADGIDAEVIYTLSARNSNLKDRDTYLAIVRAFNEYLAEEYCALDPRRLIGVGVLPNIGAEEDVAEMQRCAALGLKAVMLSTFPSGKASPTPEDDRFWAAAVDLDMPLTVHTSFPRRVGDRATSLLNYPRQGDGEERVPVDYLERMVRHGIHHCGAVEAVQLTVTGVFERFPRLQIYWAENNVGWLPYFYEQLDTSYLRNHHWAERLLGMDPLKQLPSEYLRQHAHWGFWDDALGVQLRDRIGVDRIMWSTDFPHIVTNWPHSLEVMEEQMTGVSEAEKHQMVAANAVAFFHLEP